MRCNSWRVFRDARSCKQRSSEACRHRSLKSSECSQRRKEISSACSRRAARNKKEREMATEVKENPKFEKLAGELEAWSILEIAQFGKYLQERWGVSAAPVAVAAAAGAGAGGGAAAE